MSRIFANICFFLLCLQFSSCSDVEKMKSNNFQITEIVLAKSYEGISPHWYFGLRIKSNTAISLNDNVQINVFGIGDESNQRWKIVSDSSIKISTPKLTNDPERLLNEILHYPFFARIIFNGTTEFIKYDKHTSIRIEKKFNDCTVIKKIKNPIVDNFFLNIPEKILFNQCPDNLVMIEINEN